eukprot:TRINITY_DN13601_c0_g1_i8.p1 TRINITY_DN13601_c0_g1~~TRINITY_DN13601_c0_g1_i8.p1  ORF type:complete len:135 (+),score=37.37 TRINITY_DN13601_c0_g1_i8:90-494(+)
MAKPTLTRVYSFSDLPTSEGNVQVQVVPQGATECCGEKSPVEEFYQCNPFLENEKSVKISLSTTCDWDDLELITQPPNYANRVPYEKTKLPTTRRKCRSVNYLPELHRNEARREAIRKGSVNTCLLYTSPSPRD